MSNDAYSVDDISDAESFAYSRTESTYQDWDDNQSLASICNENDIRKARQRIIRDPGELLNIDESAIMNFRERSRSRDIRGHKLVSVRGIEN